MTGLTRNPRSSRRAASVILLAACFGAAGEPLSRSEMNLLGTVCTITVYDGKASDMDAAFSRIREIDAKMSSTRPDSEVSRINGAAGKNPVTVSEDTYDVIRRGIAFAKMGNGVFDISVGPLTSLWGIGTPRARVPSDAEIRKALALMGFTTVLLGPENQRSVFLPRPGMAIDLGAIAKGYAADETARVLASRGVKTALINLGGNILTVGRKPDRTGWKIGVQNPEKPRGDSIGFLETAGISVVTSGVYERYFISNGVHYHHILDTRTGYPVENGLLAVTIVAGSSTVADGYSTLAFALGLEKGREMVERAENVVGAVFITEDRGVFVTRGLTKYFHLTDPAYSLKGWQD